MPKKPPTTRKTRIPSYRLHRASGQAVVTLDGRDHYLGPWNSKVSKTAYDRLTSEWLAGGRRLPQTLDDKGLTIVELIIRYFQFAEGYYCKNGKPTGEAALVRLAVQPLKQLYGRTPAADFKPTGLRAVRMKMIEKKWCRTNINQAVNRIRRVFRWGVSHDLVPANVLHGLQAVDGLRMGRCNARESEPVRPVPDAIVDATLAHVPSMVASMIQLQRITGMRSGELCIMRGHDLDTTGSVWAYSPEHHKTEHHGHARTIYLGPKAQAIIKPLLRPDLDAYLFSPSESEAQRRAEMHRKRKTPLSCGNRPGTNRKRRPRWTPGDHYTRDSYRKAIDRGCALAFPSPEGLTDEQVKTWRREHHWFPHQLRHSAATRLRREYGIEAARIILGHHSAAITELYAEVDASKAVEIMGKAG